ncbi:MAG: TraB/GumN family protein [Sphingopyxis sp.]|uniref:TraB/GumN family protein n=1 Tax=Sphingopyxis sp. TaxID=1908224 RepID=UPI003D811B2A
MKSWFKTLAATCAVIPFAQCAVLPGGNVAAAAEPAKTAVAAAPAATVDADPALWVVKDEDTTIYLFGTVHVLKPGLSWFDEAVKDAFDTSDEMMLELVMPEDQGEVAKVMMPLAVDPNGTTLPSRLSADELKAYQAAMTGVGLPANAFDSFEPWFAGVTLSVLPLTKLGYDPEQGAEKQLTRFAKDANKPIAGFETLGEQLGFFDALPEKDQLSFLNSVVRDMDKLGPVLDKMVVLWGKGDPDGLAVAMNESMAETPELAKILLYDRNARWADRIKTRMEQPGTVFVAVGAGHLAGDKSVQDYLKDRGLTATRVDY